VIVKTQDLSADEVDVASQQVPRRSGFDSPPGGSVALR
jgi:hypothetical protein